ncbi:MAG: GTPase [Candidatus Hydrogenedentes bacterium]|nr:GTPase [Candidatus Hydrogenedentota bacterium]
MPTNLPPEYFEAEERFKAATSVQDKIETLEELISTIPKHKGTDKLRADLRRRLSKLKAQAETAKKTGKHESVFHVEKEGPARVVLVGAPNVGKSALLSALTHAAPKVSGYPFTTWAPVPGMMPVHDIQIQLIDTPPLSTEHIEPELFNLIRTADMLLLLVDLQGRALEQIDDSIALLEQNHVLVRNQDAGSAQERRATFIPCMVLVNKTDDETQDEDFEVLKELIGDQWSLMPVSAATGRNLEQLKVTVFDRLELIRIYSKQPSKDADMTAPFVLKVGGTVEEFAAAVHRDFAQNLKTARVWGQGVHDGQMVSRDHILHDGDIVELHT